MPAAAKITDILLTSCNFPSVKYYPLHFLPECHLTAPCQPAVILRGKVRFGNN